jgi:hypothetical protein
LPQDIGDPVGRDGVAALGREEREDEAALRARQRSFRHEHVAVLHRDVAGEVHAELRLSHRRPANVPPTRPA